MIRYLNRFSKERFTEPAFLTGRSLATFKRDFENIFHCPPGQWLLERRLKQAQYLISETRYYQQVHFDR